MLNNLKEYYKNKLKVEQELRKEWAYLIDSNNGFILKILVDRQPPTSQ